MPTTALERLIWNKHDPCQPRMVRATGPGEIPMHQRALPVLFSQIALGEKLGAYAPSKARAFVRAFIGHVLVILRRLGEFVAAGGPMS
jgi:hypothetical protein